MAFNEHDVLTALDGALASASALLGFTEQGTPVHQGLIGVLGAVATARTLVEELPEPDEGDETGCSHPPEMQVLRYAGHEVYQLCQLCSTMRQTGR